MNPEQEKARQSAEAEMNSGCSKKGSSEASSSFTPGETHVLVPQADGSNTIGGAC